MGATEADPRISVLMPVFQAERYLEQAIESVLAQSFEDFELLALEDGSTDRSPQILDRVSRRDDRVRVIAGTHAGIVVRLNEGLAAARGEFIARMDADDVTHPERFARQLAYLDAHPQCVAVGTGGYEVDPDLRPIAPLITPEAHAEIESRLFLGEGGALIHATGLYRSEALRGIGGYRSGFEGGEDLDLHLRLGECGELANLPERMFWYRKNYDGVTLTRCREVRINQDRAIRDALIRRGRDPASRPVRPAIAESRPRCQIWAIWADRALVAGHRETACHYAMRAFRAAPTRYWRLAIRAALGIQPFFWARLRGGA